MQVQDPPNLDSIVSEYILERVKNVIQAGTEARVVIKHDGRTIAEFPVAPDAVGMDATPVLAAANAIVALLAECTIEVEHDEPSHLFE